MWTDKYIGRPWACPCSPPESFTCGELVRYVYLAELGIELPPILADANVIKDCINNFREYTNAYLVPANTQVLDMDILFLGRGSYISHAGLVVVAPGGTSVLHCSRGSGVVLNRLFELESSGFRAMGRYKVKGA